MSYIKKIEEDYNNGKISLKEVSDMRDKYNKKSDDEKSKLDDKYGSESTTKDKLDSKKLDNNEDSAQNWFFSILSVFIFLNYVYFRSNYKYNSLGSQEYLRSISEIRGESIYGGIFLNYFFYGLGAVLLALIISSIAVFSYNKKTAFSKIFFWLLIFFLLLQGVVGGL